MQRSLFHVFQIVLLCSVGLFNCILTAQTIINLVRRGDKITAHEYSYLDEDYPLEALGLSTKRDSEITIQESTRFTVADSYSDNVWETLRTIQPGIGFLHLGPYHLRFITIADHQLHCLQQIQEDLKKPNHTTSPSGHFDHCMQYLRQSYLCNADSTLEDGDFMAKNYTVDRTADTRQCRNWPLLFSYVNKNFDDFAESLGIHGKRNN